MRTSREFLDSLSDGRRVYYRGRLVENIAEHPVLGISALHASKLFDFGGRSYTDEELGVVSRFYRIPRNAQDLFERHRLVYDLTMFCNGVFNISQAIGSDALFALSIVSRKVDRKYGSDYSRRVERYYRDAAKGDLAIAVAQTDVKGDRSRRPSEQADPDMYLRVVDVRSGGIVVRGAKAHTTQSIVSDEIIVLPTRAMREGDKDYAISFAVPANAPGLRMYVRSVDEVEGNPSAVLSRGDIEVETLTVFDDVFVPWDRVFLFREHEFAGSLASLFATYHRFTAVSYRAATANLYLGAALYMAEANGVGDEDHIRGDIADIIMYKEIMRMGALAASLQPLFDEGIAIPNPVYTNVSKLYSNKHFPEVLRGFVDIAGGIIATLPGEEDLAGGERGVFEKYLRGAVDGGLRIKILRLAKELGASSFTGYMLTLMLHAEGSMKASVLELLRSYDYSEARGLVKKLLSIP